VLLAALVPMSQRTGVANYVRGLVGAWSAATGDPPELVVVTGEPGELGFIADDQVVKLLPLGTVRGGAIGRALVLQTAIPALARSVNADVVLTPNFLAPRWGAVRGTAVVVQDLAFARFPSTIPFARRMYYLARVRSSIRRAAAVLVSTQTMAADVTEFEPTVASRIRIAPLGVSSTHLETDSGAIERPDGGFLCVGTLEPRKNLARVLSAHGRLCRRFPGFPPLRLVGASGWGEREVADALAGHPDPKRVVRLGFCSDSELIVEYRRARALVFCSIYEGFGLPVVEAMSHGCPVLCSRGTALAEVAGDAALLVSPDDVGEIEQGMLRLALDPALRVRLAEVGRARAARFSWDECARRTIGALEELVT